MTTTQNIDPAVASVVPQVREALVRFFETGEFIDVEQLAVESDVTRFVIEKAVEFVMTGGY
jgi:hypothetical protein